MPPAYNSETSLAGESSGFLGGLLDLGRGAADIYRGFTQPAPAAQPAPARPVTMANDSRLNPWVIGAVIVAAVLGLFLALRKP